MGNYGFDSKPVEFVPASPTRLFEFDDVFVLYSTSYYYVVYLHNFSNLDLSTNVTCFSQIYTPQGEIVSSPVYENTITVFLLGDGKTLIAFKFAPPYYKFKVTVDSGDDSILIEKVVRLAF